MAELRRLLTDFRFFLLPWCIFTFIACLVLGVTTKTDLHLLINRYNNEWADHAFEYFTWLGDGFSITILCILLFAWHRGKGIIVSISCLVASLIAQLLKQFVFPGEPRPLLYFSEMNRISELHRVALSENAFINSFPSGHSTVAFAFFCAACVLVVKRPALQSLFFLLAFGIGYSRIYLSQHFLSDVTMGAFIGTATALLTVYIARRSNRISEID